MNIGDKVRLLHGREEGVIVGFTKNNLIEIEIEDGFRIPVLRSEIVIIAAEESARFKKPLSEETVRTTDKHTRRDVVSEKGLFFAFLPLNDTSLALYLLNNTDFDLPYVLGVEQERNYRVLQGNILARKDYRKVGEYNSQNFETWGVFIFQNLFFREEMKTFREATTYRIRFKASTFFKNKAQAPLLDKETYLFQIDTEVTSPQPTTIQPQKIIDSWENNVQTGLGSTAPVTKPNEEVDLHIEKLTTNLIGLANADMLQIQLKAFENALDGAIAAGMHAITFIHGVGNGVLRNEIHRRVSKHVQVKFFEDAQKDKFGYGATKVHLK